VLSVKRHSVIEIFASHHDLNQVMCKQDYNMLVFKYHYIYFFCLSVLFEIYEIKNTDFFFFFVVVDMRSYLQSSWSQIKPMVLSQLKPLLQEEEGSCDEQT
jgi:hypothetical protein